MRQALKPRPYQEEALRARAGSEAQRALVALPTGGGKTVVFAHQGLRYLEANPSDRVLVLVHTDELVQQAVAKMGKVAPHLEIGIVKAARNDVLADVIVASVQTLRNAKRLAQLRSIGHVIVDEAHHATAKSYMDILVGLGCFTPNGPRATGYTATPARGDGKGLGSVWQELVYQKDIVWMVRKKYLVNPRGISIVVPDLDLRNVKSTRTDFRTEELGEALAESLAPQVVAEAILEHATERKILMFCPTVASAYVFAEALEAAGLPARVIHGGMPTQERRDTIAWHKRGTVLVNCMILTEGYDDPEVDCVVIARPTKSQPLYIQMAGRGLRVDPARPYEEQDCLLLHVTQVGANLCGMVDLSSREVKPPRDGQTLTDLEDELDAGPAWEAADTPEYWNGPTEALEFDPLGRPTAEVWLRTREGHYFLPAGTERYVFLMEYPTKGSWCVATVPQELGRPEMTEHRGLPLDQALVWAAELAMDLGTDLNKTDKAAKWRKKLPSEKFVKFARWKGVKPEGYVDAETGLFVCTERQGSLSDRLDVLKGSQRIDPVVRAVRNR
ncbi:MAG: DEAD/DEAH box helicase [Labedaea sp.]